MAELKTPNTSAEQLITEHLDIWTTAIEQKSSSGRGSSKKFSLYGIKKLRELILELAVRGKLVPQDPTDEPASVLLERIAAEKAQLIKDKKIKKPKVLPEISEDEKQFELPKGWVWTRLGEVGSIVGGGTPKSGEASYWCEEGIKWLTPADLYGRKEKFISSGKRDITEEGLAKSSAQLLPVNSILFSSRAPIGYVAIASSPLATNQGFKSIVPFLNGFSEYIYYYLKRSARYIDDAASGTTFKEVSGLIVSKLLISLPPVLEQQRIVAKVDELMGLCDALEAQTENSITAHQTLVEVLLEALLKAPEEGATPEQATEQFQQNWQRLSEHFDTLFTTTASIDTLKQTILQLAVMGKLVPWDKGACKGELKEYLSFGPRNGFSPKEAAVITDVRVLKLGATSYGSLNLDQTKHVDVNIELNSHLWLSEGDILIQRGNSASYVGCNCLIKKDISGVIYPDLMMKLRAADGLNPKYLSIWLSAPKSRRFMWERMTGTSGTMPKISKKIVEKIPIVVPSISVQEVIITKVDELMTLCDQLKARLTDVQTTKLQLTDAIVEQAVN